MLVYQNRRSDLRKKEGRTTNLEKSFQPPDLEDTLADENGQLKDAPPFDSCVRALCSVAVHSFSDHNV
jgi:hypothetical protein